MRHITLSAAFAQWSESDKPAVIAQCGADDIPALSESWNDYSDMLCKDGALNDLQYHYAPAWDDSFPDEDDEPDFILGAMGVAISFLRVAERLDGMMQDSAHHYRALVKRGSKNAEFTTYYSTGSAIENPESVGFFNCLLMDTSDIEGADFEDWAENLGYDSDSRKAEKIFEACQKTALELKTLFSDSELTDLREIFENV